MAANSFFWRTYDQQEVDLLEERESKLFGFECKWMPPKRIKPPKAFGEAYPAADYVVLHRDNYLDYLSDS